MSFGVPTRNGLGVGLLASTSLATRNRSFSPALLFAANEPGGWYDPSDLSTMFQDSTGTTPVTATGQTVGLVLDKSRGLALGSELFSGSVPATVFRDAVTNTSVVLATSVTAGVAYKIAINISANTSTTSASFRAAGSGGSFVSSQVIAAGVTGLREYILTPTATGNLILAGDAAGVNITLSSISVKALPGNHLTQTTLANRPIYQVDGTGRGYLLFDGSDDFFVSPTINASGVDAQQVFAGVRKLSDAAQACVVAVGLNGGPAGINPEIGLLLAPGAAAADTYYWRASGSATPTPVNASGYAAPNTAVLTAEGDISDDLQRIRVNGVQFSGSGDQGTGNYGAGQILYIGRRGGTSNPFNGRIYSLIVRFGANLTTEQIAQTEAWVNSKTGAY